MPFYTKEEQFELIRDSDIGWERLKQIDNQYEEVCLEAINQNALAIEYVKNKTDKLCLKAVQKYGPAINYIDNQKYKICVEAIKNTIWAVPYIKNLTKELLFLAISNFYDLQEDDNLNSNTFEIKNKIFFIQDYYDSRYNFDNILKINAMLFRSFENYLLNDNNNNCFIVEPSIDRSILSKIVCSNNTLIVAKEEDEELDPIYNTIANKIVIKKELKNWDLKSLNILI